MSIEKLLEHTNNIHVANRYLKFINYRITRKLDAIIHIHHILPKAKDMFPEFKDLKKYPWNGIALTPREHFIAHWMLAKMFPKTSQSRTFYYMTNELSKRKSKDYALAKIEHIENMKNIYTKERNLKISKALRGRPKSEDHIKSLIGHTVTDDTRLKLRLHNLGKTHSQESKEKMSKSRTGVKKHPLSDESKYNISKAKKELGLKWFNNGEVSKLFVDPPDGWTKGRLKWIK